MTPVEPRRAVAWTLEPDGLLWVRLQGEPLNELGEAALAGLEGALEAGRAPGVRGVLLSSAQERGFSAGADLRALSQAIAARGLAAVAAGVRGFLARIHATFDGLDGLAVPTVAAVHGVCFGGGLELALCCDVRVADRTARFAFPELRLGLVPGFGGLTRLSRDVPAAVVRDLLLTGRSLNAERAHAVGLVSQVTASGRALDAARAAARAAMRLDPAALAAAKRLLKPIDRAALDREVDAFLALFERPEVARALADFVARRDALPYLAPRKE